MGKLYRVKKESVLFKKGEKITEIPIEDIVKIKEVRTQTSGASPSPSLFAQRIGRSTYVVDQARLQQMISNPAQIMTDARLRPNVSAGRENGYTLSEVKPGGIYQSLGLQERRHPPEDQRIRYIKPGKGAPGIQRSEGA